MHVNRGVFFKWGVVSFVVAALLVGFSGAALAQETTGTLTGTVTDQKGLAMTGVSVLVHSEDTGVDQVPVMTGESGVYTVPLLQVGTYDVTASQAGFGSVDHKGVTLQVGQTVRVDFQMSVAATQTLVTVTTEVPTLETEKTEQSQNVSETLVSNLPVSSRRWEQFALLTPGSAPDGTNGSVSFHGINSMYNNNSVDGANNNTAYDQTTRGGYNAGYVYSSDSIREFQVASGSYNAELGQAAGASVNAITKSGTSAFHGDAFYAGRSPDFNAYDEVSKASGTPTQNIKQQDQFGGSFGGPIIKDKLFFYGNVDVFKRVDPISVPDTAAVQVQNMICPQGGVSATAGGPALTAAQIQPMCTAAENYLNAHDLGVFPQELSQFVELAKFDYQINASNHFNVVGDYRDYRLPIPNTLTNNTTTSVLQDRFVIATLNTVIGSNKVNEFRYQFGRDNNIGTRNQSLGAPGVTLGFVTYGNEDGSGFTAENRNQFTDNFTISRGVHTIKFGVDINVLQDDVRGSTNSLGPYTYSGVSLPTLGGVPNLGCSPSTYNSAQANANEIFCDWIVDLYGLSSTLGDTNPTGQHYSNFNQFHDLVENGPPASFAYNMPTQDYAGYIQDTWKARPNVTVNYGLRYDLQNFPHLPNSPLELCQTINPSECVNGTATDVPILDYFTQSYPDDYGGIQPRLGVAWNLRKNTVVRIGGGLFVAKTDLHNLKNVFSGVGEATTKCTTPLSATTCPSTALTFPDLLFEQQDVPPGTLPLAGAVQPTVLFPQGSAALNNVALQYPNPKFGFRGADPTLKRPRATEAELAVEQQLPGNFNLSVTYAFTRGNDLPRGQDGNLTTNFDPNVCSTAAVTAGSTTGQTCGVNISKVYNVLNANGSVNETISVPLFWQRLNPATGPIGTNRSDVNSMYNGLIVTLRKPATHGFEILANYTFSRAEDDGEQGSNNGANGTGLNGQVGEYALNPYNTKLEQGLSTTDVPNRFTASVVYTPPYTKNLNNKMEREVLDGWSIAGTLIASNGTHFEEQMGSASTTAPIYSTAAGDPLFAPGGTVALTGSAATFTPLNGGMTGATLNSPGSPYAGRAYFVGRNSAELPNLYDVDLRVTKNIAIKERYRIEFRAEAFNLFNTTLIQAENLTAFNYLAPGKTSGAITCGGTQTCIIPNSGAGGFGTPLVTSASSGQLGNRQLQAALRFDF